jgi:hypothetical protein
MTTTSAKVIVIDPSNLPVLDEDWRDRIEFVRSYGEGVSTWNEYKYSGGKEYKQYLRKDVDGNVFGLCTCPASVRKNATKTCKHIYAATLLLDEGSCETETKKEDEQVTIVKDEGELKKRTNDMLVSDSMRPVRSGRVFWPSKVDLVEKCPASYIGDQKIGVVVERSNDAATIGRTVHKIAEGIVSGEIKEIERSFIVSECVKAGIENCVDDVELLCENAMSAWNGSEARDGLRVYFNKPQTEQYASFEHTVTNPYTGLAEKVSFSGYLDVSEVFSAEEIQEASVKNWAVVLDFKTGRLSGNEEEDYMFDVPDDPDGSDGEDSELSYETPGVSHRGQMLSYAVMLMANDKKLEQVTTIICYLRNRKSSIATFTRDEIRGWFKSFLRRSAFWDGVTYNPGDHCMWCKRFYVCPARAQMISSAVSGLIGAGDSSMIVDGDNNLVDPDKIYEAYKQSRLLKKIISKFEEDLKAETTKRGFIGIPSLAGNRGFGYTSRKGSMKIDSKAAWDTLLEYFTDDELSNIVNVSKGALEETAKKKAPKGKKAAFVREIMDGLSASGAVSRAKDSNVFGVIDVSSGGEDDQQ